MSRRGLVFGIATLVTLLSVGSIAGMHYTRAGRDKSSSHLADSQFWARVNNDALLPVERAGEQAQIDLNAVEGAETSTLKDDGLRVASAADNGRRMLASLTRLTSGQAAYRSVIQSFLAANRRYGLAVESYGETGDFAALAGAAESVRSVRSIAASALPPQASLPSSTLFDLSEQGAPDVPDFTAYTDQIDTLLRNSHDTLTQIRSFVSQASSGAITRRAAVEEARGFVRQRVEVLDAVVNLKAPAGFGHAHELLAESLRLSIDDDRALVNWAIDRRDGGSGRAQFAEANRLGIKAGVVKKTFLSAYRSARAAVGLDSASLPAQY